MQELIVNVATDGTLQFVDHHGAVAGLFAIDAREIRTTRASRVVPTNVLKRCAFRTLRRLVSDGSRPAQWSRTWRGPWFADLAPVNGPVLGPFPERHSAIDAEVAWLQRNIIGA